MPINNVQIGLGSSSRKEKHKGYIITPIYINKEINPLQATDAR